MFSTMPSDRNSDALLKSFETLEGCFSDLTQATEYVIRPRKEKKTTRPNDLKTSDLSDEFLDII